MFRSIRLAATIVVASSGVALAAPQQLHAPASTKAAKPRLDRYQVPAGAALLLKLRTPLDSATAKVDDQVEATFWSPLIQDGIELVPVGSVVLGRVVEVVPAGERALQGSLAFAFSIVEHAETGSRATMNTKHVVIEAPRPEEPQRGRGKTRRKPVDATMAPGTAFVAVTTQPMIVRIPR